MIYRKRTVILTLLAAVLATGRIGAADGPPFDRGPAKVVTAHAERGVLAPQGEFRGSVYFKEVSEVATEVQGKVNAVLIEEGQHVREGQLLVKLDDELLRKDLGAMEARLDRDRTELEDAELRLRRAQDLAKRGLMPTEQLDETRFDVQSLRYSVTATEAQVERVKTLIQKSAIYAPFDGVVLERMTEIGEWKNDGDTIAVIAREDIYEVVVDVPETSVPFMEPGMEVELNLGGETVTGTLRTVIPRGDIATRTFPAKIHVESDMPLYEGMAALARLPVGKRVESLIVPRDAVLNRQGNTMVFTVQDAFARQHYVDVVGYDGMKAGIVAPDLGPGQLFIVKGHERLQDGERVEVVSVPAAGEDSGSGVND